jgi:hypothetical protein
MTKPIQIRNEDVVRDIRELAARRGIPITQTVAELARNELARHRREAPGTDRSKVIDETVARFQAAMKTHGGLPLTDDDLYDGNGLPR